MVAFAIINFLNHVYYVSVSEVILLFLACDYLGTTDAARAESTRQLQRSRQYEPLHVNPLAHKCLKHCRIELFDGPPE